MTQELIERLRCPSIYSCPFEPNKTTCAQCQKTVKLEAADTIQYLLDVADDVNQALQEQIEENERLKSDIKRKDESLDYARTIMADNERLKAENVWLKSMNERLSRPTLSKLRRENNQLESDNERLKAELEAAIKDIMCLDHCDVCVHSRERNWSCEAADFDCLVCKDENCTCRGCRDENKWQWRGVERRI